MIPLEDVDPVTIRARTRIGVVLQDKWRLDALLGLGGMAAVYAATHRNGKRVAVKMLHAEFSHDEEVRARFLQEGYAANAIQHDGAVSVLDDDVAADGSAFLVMELLEGETVEELWEKRGQRLDLHELLSIVDPLLGVLEAAHAKNVVHRDIKPDNLFVTSAGVLKVLDFGIAKVFEKRRERTTSTRVGMVMGTPAYMAPEQALARWDEVDGRTDLWAVGATMFTMLSGRFVHEAPTSQEQIVMSATVTAPSLSSVVAGIPASVVSIVDRALAFDRTKRWPDASSMRREVRSTLEALGGPSALGGALLASTVTLVSRDAGGATRAATLLDTTSAGSSEAAWIEERERGLAEVARLRARTGELAERQTDVKKRVAAASAKVDAGRAERKSLEQWFQRQVGTRTVAVEDARREVRRHMVTLARRAIEDRDVFGSPLDSAREGVAKLERAAESAARDVDVHAAALDAYDAPSLRLGVLLSGVLAIILLALLIAPIVWRATLVVNP